MIFHDPWNLYRDVEEMMGDLPPSRLFTDNFRILREQWCASFFGIGYEKYLRPCKFAVDERLESRGIDFVMEVEGKKYPFQTTEVLERGRKRGEEVREIEKGNIVLRSYMPARGGQEGPDWIVADIAKKAEKHYAGSEDLNLLVYVDFEAHGLNFNVIKEKAKMYCDSFSSICLITDEHIASLIPNATLGEIKGV